LAGPLCGHADGGPSRRRAVQQEDHARLTLSYLKHACMRLMLYHCMVQYISAIAGKMSDVLTTFLIHHFVH
jgi:hypothetical protein